MMAVMSFFRVPAVVFFAVWACSVSVLAGSGDPFPAGYLMMSQGAIVDTEGAGGREPWVSAAFYRDTLRWGAAAAAVGYHGGAAARYAVGGFGVFGPAVGKAAVTQLDVMGVYYEQAAVLSAGGSWRFLSFGADAYVRRAGLYGRPDDTRLSAALGAAALVKTRRVSADAAVQNIAVSSAGPDAGPPLSVFARVCAIRNRYGSQGAMITVTPGVGAPVRFALAQEYRIGGAFAFSASIASNPTMIGFGVAIDKAPINGSAAVVNHPFLGWSRGMAADYAR